MRAILPQRTPHARAHSLVASQHKLLFRRMSHEKESLPAIRDDLLKALGTLRKDIVDKQ
jgi:hypothetical protein